MPIKSFTHKGLKRFYYKGDESGIDPNHVIKIADILDSIRGSHHPADLKAFFGQQFQEKKGSGKGVFSIEVNGNWRVTFEIEDDGAILVDYRDYHGKQIKSKK
ncbi:MAG: plasmid maintenance system killer [Gammaproteobacteria bacterium]|nr:MAG: plasmid maintenance system killer [Gammaproteobacteria bacterium]